MEEFCNIVVGEGDSRESNNFPHVQAHPPRVEGLSNLTEVTKLARDKTRILTRSVGLQEKVV